VALNFTCVTRHLAVPVHQHQATIDVGIVERLRSAVAGLLFALGCCVEALGIAYNVLSAAAAAVSGSLLLSGAPLIASNFATPTIA